MDSHLQCLKPQFYSKVKLSFDLKALGEESTSILPEYVISIDADDDFLRGRAISIVESELGQSDGNELT